ncbi:uncharacterized protein LOC142167374 [Nicotiana tabacum]|uniref:Uncharacterized protein LOC142167374 n=1 Tax=Nicotiana tabacum TaxID=4097 RepID=A0AC58SFD3_TOBAC
MFVVNNDDFHRNFRDLVDTDRPCLVALLETRMRAHASLLNNFNFTEMIEVPVEGQSGGMAILYDHNLITVNNFTRRGQEIHVMIKVLPFRFSWLLSTIYASIDIHARDIMWEKLTNISNSYKGGWLVGGDFNDITMSSKRFRGRTVSISRTSSIWNYINKCRLMDLGYKGSKFTWSNHRKRLKGLIIERLDHFFANEEWANLFSNATVTHLPKTYSDHKPLLLNLNSFSHEALHKPFRSENIWCTYSDFVNLVRNNWLNSNLLEATHRFTINVSNWSKETFGDNFRKKKRILARLKGIQNSHNYVYSLFLQNLEFSLKEEFNNIFKLEEDCWRLRSRIFWLSDGDANTTFFHITASNGRRRRRRRNHISFFKDDQGNWIDKQRDILTHAQSFFVKSFKTSYCLTNKTDDISDLVNFDSLDLSPLSDSELPMQTSPLNHRKCLDQMVVDIQEGEGTGDPA